MARLFGSNGVRGIVNQEFTIELASGLAAAVGHLLGKDIAVGRDGRTSSPMVRDAVVSSLLSVGCNVHDLGAVPTPALQYMIKHMGWDGGVMVTASHNTPEFSGIKVEAGDGVEVSKDTEAKIEELYFKGDPKPVTWDMVGQVYSYDSMDSYIEAVTSHVDLEAIKERSFKVVLDTGNGVASITAPEIASKLGCEVFTINTEIDGTFPGRGSEPTPENLGALKELMKATDADLGVGFDGDGDRSIIMDEHGVAVWGDSSLSLIADWYMETHPGITVVTSVSTSQRLEQVVEAKGGKVHWCKVGSVLISRAMVDLGAPLGGEENGGIMYGPFLPVRDGAMVMSLLLHIMAERGKPLSELIAEQPMGVKGKDKIPCPNHVKDEVLRRLPEVADAPIVDTTDGVKLIWEDDSWVMVRPSGTEPIARVYAEADTEEKVKQLIEEYKKKASELIESLK
ncbi:MAG: phosphoglucosamine mutase [Candidatus Bathyarchaeota archaeon]|nr:phosphoglucosamine mutase [Candidatus Bathyarchaeota archaeon]